MRTRCSSSDLLPTKSFSSGSVGFSSGSVVRNLPAMQETRVLSLDQEDPLEKEMATHSSVLAWRSLVGIQSMGSPKSQTRLID